MNNIKILNRNEKKKIETQLLEQFGIDSIPGLILKRGEERLFLFSGNYSEKEMQKIQRLVPIERVGVYFAKIVPGENGIRLSIEGTQILKDKIKKNIFELNQQEAEDWMKGRDLQIKTGFRGFLVMKHGKDFLGTGKASQEKIGNFIPKSRRLKEKS